LFVLALLADIFTPMSRVKVNSMRVSCANNLKQIGTAYRISANDHGDRFPSEVGATNGGWREQLSRGNAGAGCWKNYAFMSNELGQSTKVLVCRTDERMPAADFSQITNNLSLSYFVGAAVDDTYPQGILAGDRNLAPGTIPKKDYGYSPDNGQGNDVVIKGPVCWSLKMHSDGNPAGAGNILLGDGSAQQVTSAGFRTNWFKRALQNGPTSYSGLRLIFP